MTCDEFRQAVQTNPVDKTASELIAIVNHAKACSTCRKAAVDGAESARSELSDGEAETLRLLGDMLAIKAMHGLATDPELELNP